MPQAERAVLLKVLPVALGRILSGDPDGPRSPRRRPDRNLLERPGRDEGRGGVADLARDRGRTEAPGAATPLIASNDPSVLGVVGPALVDRKAGPSSFRGRDARQPRTARLAQGRRGRARELPSDGARPPAQGGRVAHPAGRAGPGPSSTRPSSARTVPASALNVNQVRQLGASKDREVADRVKNPLGDRPRRAQPGPGTGHREP